MAADLGALRLWHDNLFLPRGLDEGRGKAGTGALSFRYNFISLVYRVHFSQRLRCVIESFPAKTVAGERLKTQKNDRDRFMRGA